MLEFDTTLAASTAALRFKSRVQFSQWIGALRYGGDRLRRRAK